MSEVAKGFRLQRMEVFNWGTFHEAVWTLAARGENVLLTGDNGSGKSTFIDAITTLLVPSHHIAYNKAAGANSKERSVGSYVRGHYSATKSEQGPGAKPIHLRTTAQYTILLGVFASEDLGASVTIAQVYWYKEEQQTQPERFYVVADADLSIAAHFSGFGGDMKNLKRRLVAQGVEVVTTYVEYERQICKRFGLTSQAIELFHQTVSMKAVESLTAFVRAHMLEADAVDPIIAQLIEHHDNLVRAHHLVREAEVQVKELKPIVAGCEAFAEVERQKQEILANQAHVPAWIGAQWKRLIQDRRVVVFRDVGDIVSRLHGLDTERQECETDRDRVRIEVAQQGGHRLEQIAADIQNAQRELARVEGKRAVYRKVAERLKLLVPDTRDAFLEQQRSLAERKELADDAAATTSAKLTSHAVRKEEFERELRTILDELRSLGTRPTNIPGAHVQLRAAMCATLPRVPVEDLPFVGELLRVRREDLLWEGGIERVLRGFAITLMVPELHFRAVRQYTHEHHLGMRLDFFPVREVRTVIRRTAPTSRHLISKLDIQPGIYRNWLEQHLLDRFDYECCDTPEAYDRATRGILPSGLVKIGERHSKNDAHRVDDRRQYVLGWSNAEKIAMLTSDSNGLKQQIGDVVGEMAEIHNSQRDAKDRRDDVIALLNTTAFEDLDSATHLQTIAEREREQDVIRGSSNQLQALEGRLKQLNERLEGIRQVRDRVSGEKGTRERELSDLDGHEREADRLVADLQAVDGETIFPRLDLLRDAGNLPPAGDLNLTSVQGIQSRCLTIFHERAQKISVELQRLSGTISRSMQDFIGKHHQLCQELVAGTDAAPEFTQLLRRLEADDLPTYADRFKRALNENSIRDVIRLRLYLDTSRNDIRERVRIINTSLREIEYNPGTYIQLDATESNHNDIREFRSRLDACTSNTLTGSDDDAYSEQKFMQVTEIVDRLRGRPESASADATWRALVTDVRNWFDFSAIEKSLVDNQQVCYYADSSGKSGGQKEKLAYTVLGASIAYQFGAGNTEKPRTFRFVVIDEAFHRASDEYARYALTLFQRLGLQLLIATPLQKIPIIEPFVSVVGYVTITDGKESSLRNLTIEEHLQRRQQMRMA